MGASERDRRQLGWKMQSSSVNIPILSHTMLRNIAVSLALLLFAALPNAASAYWPYLGYGGYGGYGYGWGFNQATNYVPSPPYYAIYPPVYYSHQITARHYGASPFAWSPGMEPITYVGDAAGAAIAEPEIIENPYVTKNASKQASAAEKAVEPMKMDNPFVVRADR